MAEQKKRIEAVVTMLRERLLALQTAKVDERQRPMIEVSILAVRAALSDAGAELARLAF